MEPCRCMRCGCMLDIGLLSVNLVLIEVAATIWKPRESVGSFAPKCCCVRCYPDDAAVLGTYAKQYKACYASYVFEHKQLTSNSVLS